MVKLIISMLRIRDEKTDAFHDGEIEVISVDPDGKREATVTIKGKISNTINELPLPEPFDTVSTFVRPVGKTTVQYRIEQCLI